MNLKKFVLRTSVMAVLSASLLLTAVGCSDDDDDNPILPPPPPPPPKAWAIDSALVLNASLLDANRAWVDDGSLYGGELRDGFMFDSTGAFRRINTYSGKWEYYPATEVNARGTVTTVKDAVGRMITVNSGELYFNLESGKTAEYTLNRTGNTLTVTAEFDDGTSIDYVFTNTAVNPVEPTPGTQAKSRYLANRRAKAALMGL